MKVSPQEYNSMLHNLKDPNMFTAMLRIPKDEPIYEINLNTRIIKAPKFLSVEEDHNSEIIWFKVDRFFDNIDLYNGACWIQYKNANKEEFFYGAPLLISVDEYGKEIILIPWAIGESVSKISGTVEFSFQFFKLTEDNLQFKYRLNTLSSKSKILSTLKIDPRKWENIEENQANLLADELHRLTNAYEQLSKDYELYWIEV